MPPPAEMQILTTDRLSIREFELDDVAFIVELLNDPAFHRYIGDKGVRNCEDARDYLLDGPIASYRSNGFGLFHVAELETGTSVGMCGLLLREQQEHADIGYAFLEAYRGAGMAFEAAAAVLDYGRQQLKLNPIVAFVDPDNAASIRLLKRLDMHYAGSGEFDGAEKPHSIYST